MADNNNVNRDNQTNVAEDDPFAELARIMNQGAQGDVPEPADEAEPEADPFAVDLEQELLGDLGEVDAAYAAQPAAAEPRVEAAEEFDPDTTDPTDTTDEAEDYLAEAKPEPESWQSGNHQQFSDAQSADDDYWANAEPLTEHHTGPEAGEADWQPGAAHADSEDAVLADVDMDFGDLDAPAADAPADTDEQFIPVEEESAQQFAEAPQADAAGGDGVSIEQELEMLLADGPPAPDFRDERHDRPAPQEEYPAAAEDDYSAEDALPAQELPAQETQPAGSTIFTRANLTGNGGGETDDYAARDEEPALAADDDTDAATDSGEVEADPFASLSAIAPEVAQPEPAAAAAEFPADFETVDVPETALAQEDDLDLPDLPRDEPAANGLADDFDADFAYEFPAVEEPARTVSAVQDEPIEDENRFYAEALGFSAAAGTARGFDQRDEAAGASFGTDMERELDDALQDPAAYAMPAEEQPARRNGFLIAGVVIAVALIGGIGAFALSLGGGDSDTPVLVSADDQPTKVKPEDPGGAAQVPNQDSVAYEAASGGDGDQAPQQESLVTTTEEPVNIASRTAETGRLPGVDEVDRDLGAGGDSGKVEDRLTATVSGPASEMSDEIVAVQPRRVRTMIVRPDGTLVPREEAEPQNAAPAVTESAAAEQPATDAEPQALTPAPEATPAVEEEPVMDAGDVAAEQTIAAAETPDAAPVEEIVETPAATTSDEEQIAATQEAEPVTPSEGPVAPSRPAVQTTTEQPERVAQAAAATTRTQPAAPEPAATAASEWSMQIASQPTAESAQTTYQELARRYGNLLDGRGVNIVRAEIPGKGTYYRVRIPTPSRDDGITLCERYKAAGGSCFVSK